MTPAVGIALGDVELARKCASGQPEAQRQLFHDYRRQVHAILYRILGSNRDMEDLVQDSFIQVFKSLPNFRGEAKLSTWIGRITTRVALGHISRRRPPEVHLESVPMPADDDPSAESRMIAREAARRLYRALDQIDPTHRVAFALHVIDGRPLRDVADMMNASLAATKSRVWRARKELDGRARKDPLLAGYLQSDGETVP